MCRHSSRDSLVFRFGLPLLLLAAFSTHVLAAPCVGKDPTAVLTCYVAAYEGRDLSALDALLASDYQFVRFEGEKDSYHLGRAEDLITTKRMFEDPTLRALHLVLGKPIVTPIEKPTSGTREWKLSGMHWLLTLDAVNEGKTTTYTVDHPDMWLSVREVTEPTRHFEIFRMEEHAGAGK